MFENQPICPYTGLRSFTEEESLYFKGREEDIDQATAQLQKNKFLMLTGASGDGKSSLIYAGIIPNARAGFLKSRYTQWCVADFRPERSPFENLSASLARQLDIADERIVSSELAHGFSALIDLYKNSKRFVDTDSLAWQEADEKGRAAIKREAANLIILVDQFEEFFTNPENYRHGQTSRESNLVLNLLLESARIALEEDLPVYVVFTMRSDYIGQCAAFRGLPEYLGFSQYFVPRLNRLQLQQVIEEPAVLSGNQISRRLTERLIHDITEGVDQLPILQHALNQIWLAANDGSEEMDLIHYAMVGGMDQAELQEEEAVRFERWFSQLGSEIKACYHKPSLQNVLDTHTNKLYEQAEDYYIGRTGKALSDTQSKQVIRGVFTCLTKIDQGRAVRNRMTLQEITDVIGVPALGTSEVCAIVNIFREPGNTFIHPFISSEDESTKTLAPGQVLDITHESLIRNWKYLGQWAKEEFDSRAISLDFEQQLGRWVDSGKSKDFLLPIGPLTYFEKWFTAAKPNAYWIARYLPDDGDAGAKLSKAKEVLGNAHSFLQQSATKHAVTRAVMKLGTRRIAAALGGILILVSSSFAVSTYFSRKNNTVLQAVKSQSLELMPSKDASFQFRSFLGVELFKQGIANPDELISTQKDLAGKANMAIGFATQLTLQGYGEPRAPLLQMLGTADSIIRLFSLAHKNPDSLQKMLKEINDFRSILELAYAYTADPAIAAWRDNNAVRAATWAKQILQSKPPGFTQINEWALALEHGLNHRKYTGAEIRSIAAMLSPFEHDKPSDWVQHLFQQDNMMERGEQGYGFFFNGLYQELAYLYAAEGNALRTLQCLDSLLKYSANNYQGDYAAGADNATNIAYVFYKYGHEAALDSFVQGYCLVKKTTAEDFYARVTGRMIHERATAAGLDLYWWMNKKLNMNVRFASHADMEFMFRKYRQAIMLHPDTEHRKLYTAIALKNEGMLSANNASADPAMPARIRALFDQAMETYAGVSPGYLNEQTKTIGISGADQMVIPRKNLFIYPDMRVEFHPLEPRAFIHFYLNDAFIRYVLETNRFDSLFQNQEDLLTISEWLSNMNVKMFVPFAFLAKPLSLDVMEKLAAELERRNALDMGDFNVLYLELGYKKMLAGDSGSTRTYYSRVKPERFANLLRGKEYGNNVNSRSFRMMAYAFKGLMETGATEQAKRVLTAFKRPANRSSIYAFAAAEIYSEKGDLTLARRLIDSAMTEGSRIVNVRGAQLNREVIAYALALQDPDKNRAAMNQQIKNLPVKARANSKLALAFAFHNQLYKADALNTGLIPDDDRTLILWMILFGRQLADTSDQDSWRAYNENYLKLFTKSIEYDDESS
jgi:energy-coupling factor transporter ATP-binding protein EcfA2